MGAPWSQIDRKAEDAFKKLIQALAQRYNSTTQIIKGTEYTARTTPSIYIICDSAEPEYVEETEFNTGNWRCSMRIGLVTNPEDTGRADRMNMAGELWDIFMRTEIVDLLNNQASVPDFHVYGGDTTEGAGESWTVAGVVNQPFNDHLIVSELTGILYCRPQS